MLPRAVVVVAATLAAARAATLVLSKTQLYAEEWASTSGATYDVSLASAPSSDVTVSIVSSDDALATANASTLTFTASSYGPQTVRVLPVDDSSRRRGRFFF